MIIDTHAHVTGPMEMYEYFRGLAGTSGGGARVGKFELTDERLEESLADHLAEVGGVGTELQLISPRPWAVPTADRREALVMQISQQVNDMVARCVKLHPDRFVGLGALPQRPGVSVAGRPRSRASERQQHRGDGHTRGSTCSAPFLGTPLS